MTDSFLDEIRDLLVQARVVQLEVAADVLHLDEKAAGRLAALRRQGWDAVRLEPAGSGAWVTLVRLTNDGLGLRRFSDTGVPVADEAWFAFDAAGVAGIAAALHV